MNSMTAHSTTLHYKSEDWFSSYLNNRIQSTQMVPHISNIANVSCGVPQGSLLGLLRFYCILMTRDCSNKLSFISWQMMGDLAELTQNISL